MEVFRPPGRLLAVETPQLPPMRPAERPAASSGRCKERPADKVTRTVSTASTEFSASALASPASVQTVLARLSYADGHGRSRNPDERWQKLAIILNRLQSRTQNMTGTSTSEYLYSFDLTMPGNEILRNLLPQGATLKGPFSSA